MREYLDKKGIKFKDERLNCAINLTAHFPMGKKKLDLLFKNITDEAIEVIDSKQTVVGIPGKNGFTFETEFSEFDDPSFNSTLFYISVVKDDISYDFCFNLSYFHSKACFNDNVCMFNISKKLYDRYGEYLDNKEIEGNDVIFYIATDSFGNKKPGLYTNIGLDNRFKVSNINVENLLSTLRSNLKERRYYIELDKETCKTIFPTRYEFYNIEEMKIVAEYCRKVKIADDFVFDWRRENVNEDCLTGQAQYNLMCREINELYKQVKEQGFYYTYEEWASFYDYPEIKSLTYNEWLVKMDTAPDIVVDMAKVPVLDTPLVSVSNNSYAAYNPNKLRYEDEEDLDIDNSKKR